MAVRAQLVWALRLADGSRGSSYPPSFPHMQIYRSIIDFGYDWNHLHDVGRALFFSGIHHESSLPAARMVSRDKRLMRALPIDVRYAPPCILPTLFVPCLLSIFHALNLSNFIDVSEVTASNLSSLPNHACNRSARPYAFRNI